MLWSGYARSVRYPGWVCRNMPKIQIPCTEDEWSTLETWAKEAGFVALNGKPKRAQVAKEVLFRGLKAQAKPGVEVDRRDLLLELFERVDFEKLGEVMLRRLQDNKRLEDADAREREQAGVQAFVTCLLLFMPRTVTNALLFDAQDLLPRPSPAALENHNAVRAAIANWLNSEPETT